MSVQLLWSIVRPIVGSLHPCTTSACLVVLTAMDALADDDDVSVTDDLASSWQ